MKTQHICHQAASTEHDKVWLSKCQFAACCMGIMVDELLVQLWCALDLCSLHIATARYHAHAILILQTFDVDPGNAGTVAGEIPGTSLTSSDEACPVTDADDRASVDDHLQELQASTHAAAADAQSAPSVTSGKPCLVVSFLIIPDGCDTCHQCH